MGAKLDETKGRIKSAAGELTGNEQLKTEGKIDKASGKIKGVLEKAGDRLKKAAR